MHSFTFNGQTSTDFGIGIERFRPLNRPARKYDVANIAGRNGNIYDLKDVWDEVSVSYEIWAAKTSNEDLHAVYTNIMEWLNSADGYAELTDTYDTNHYRLAVFVDSTDIANSWNTKGRAVITFRCRPERFLSAYEDVELTVSDNATSITNPTNHNAKPLIKLTGTGETSKIKTTGRTAYDSSGSEIELQPLPSINTSYMYLGINRGAYTSDSSLISSYSLSAGTVTLTTSMSYIGIGLVVKVMPSTTYTLSCSASSTSGYIEFYAYDETGTYISNDSASNTSGTTSLTFRTPRNCQYAMFGFSSTISESSITYSDIMLNYGSTAMNYIAYDDGDPQVFVIMVNGDNTMSLNFSQYFETAYVDLETEQAYIGDANLNPVFSADWNDGVDYINDFPVLLPGTTSITLYNATAIEMNTRFWEM